MCVCVCVKEAEGIQEVRHFPPVMHSFNFLCGVSSLQLHPVIDCTLMTCVMYFTVH